MPCLGPAICLHGPIHASLDRLRQGTYMFGFASNGVAVYRSVHGTVLAWPAVHIPHPNCIRSDSANVQIPRTGPPRCGGHPVQLTRLHPEGSSAISLRGLVSIRATWTGSPWFSRKNVAG